MINIPQPGTKIEVKQEKNEKKIAQIGTVLPRGELFAPGILVLKLENGYNVGIAESSISEITVLEEAKVLEKPKFEVTIDKNLPTIAFISFGGTISSRLDYKTGGVVADYTAEDFYEMMPELKDIANIKSVSAANKMSEDMNFADYEHMVKTLIPFLEDKSIQGVVVTQGTDTLHYSTAAMSFMLGKLNKPVIFTASQRSIDRGSSDAFENIICAVRAAVEWDGACVVTCMHETSDDGSCLLIRGTKVRKMHTSRRNSFRPINDQALARIDPWGDITSISNTYPKREDNAFDKTVVIPSLKSKIGLLYVYPNIQKEQIAFFEEKQYDGLVIAATALGHVPESILAEVIALGKKIPIIITSQTLYGRVHPLVYARLREMSIEGNLLFAEDMMPEVAYVKLACVLSQTKDTVEIRQKMLDNVAGEFAGEIDEKSYLN